MDPIDTEHSLPNRNIAIDYNSNIGHGNGIVGVQQFWCRHYLFQFEPKSMSGTDVSAILCR